MAKKQPWEYQLALIADRLNVIAEALLDVYYDVQKELDTDLDSSYTRGTTTFGRQKNKLIQLCKDARYPWLDLRNTSNDLTCAIDGIPFRFFTDDHEKPQKPGFWKRNEQDNLFPTDEDEPIYWRFIIEKPLTDEDEAAVYFLGANSNQVPVCEWKYEESVRVFKTVDNIRPDAVDTPEPNVGLPKQDQEKKDDTGS
ncbi:hypothetical protein ACO0K7_18935 [Undibacterium sp. Ji67W]|jgi:hypothetical protein|uniref:hypothetical protein n=1 Tax=Undibacterium sp. Ji67W TaxID=3413042 RepID=UPI003BF25CB2